MVKRLFDIAGSAAGLLVLSPLLLGIALAIKLTSAGPVLFWQERVGFRGQRFRILKFRTLFSDRCDPSGRSQIDREDNRVTPIGRILRTKSLDELPQLVNVLRGEMSLVGPRPHVSGMQIEGRTYEVAVPYYAEREAMKPGITGWAQVNQFRGPTLDFTTAVARVHHDIAYIQNFSLALDMQILLMTIWIEALRGTGQ